MNPSRNETVKETVVRIVAASLAIEPEQVHQEAKLIQDLGMDSLDFMDILFLLEKEFQRPLRDADFNRVLRPDRSEMAMAGEFLTAEEISRLAPLMPSLAQAAALQPVRRKDLFAFLTAGSLIRMVERKLSEPQ